jgi:secondary thiamine-phosphate synthase enzyme
MVTLTVSSGSQTEWIDISRLVQKAIADSGVSEGVAFLFVPHTTAGITINEGADPSVVEDIQAYLNQAVPFKGPYRHGEGNSPAHIKASLIGSSVLVGVEKGRPVLGTWQAIFFCEFDGPRKRRLYLKILPA